MKKSILVILCLLFTGMTANVQSQTKSPCQNLGQFLKTEFFETSKPLKTNKLVRIVGVQEKNAFQAALTVCVKLNATRLNSDSKEDIYELDGLGKIVIQEVYKDGLFVKMRFASKCPDLPFKEIWYVSLKYYTQK